ncbi:MAG: UDP-glucose 4-epimerase GalE [Mogibacterium sp.]|nr:UDP-glucose 4-epimerase GalE [Mogibacterium sp.]
MKALLTGGAGYIGSHTAVAMLEAGHEVAVIDNYYNSSAEAIRRVEKITGKNINMYEADVADKDKLRDILKTEMPDCIIHFAGLKAVGESVEKPVEYYRNNIDTTLALLEVMKELGLTNIVFSSSATVYGEDNVPPFTEDMPKGRCTNPYGWTKWMQEQILTDAQLASASAAAASGTDGDGAAELSVVLLRYFNPVGAHESGMIGEDPKGIPNNLMPYISQLAVGRRDHLTVFGDDYDTPDGTCRRDYIHVMDLAEGHVKAAEYCAAHKGTEVINLGTGEPYSVLDMVKAFGEACGSPVRYEIGPRRAGDVQDSWADADKAKRLLGWEASRGIREICRDAWKWQSGNPEGYGE